MLITVIGSNSYCLLLKPGTTIDVTVLFVALELDDALDGAESSPGSDRGWMVFHFPTPLGPLVEYRGRCGCRSENTMW